MIELTLILGINLLGLAFATLAVRWMLRRARGGQDAQRLTGAVERAVTTFLWREGRLVGAQTLAVLGAVVALAVYAARSNAHTLDLEAALASALGLVVGAASTCVVGYLAAQLGVHAAARTVAAERSLDDALVVSMRTGGALGIVVEALSLVGVCAIFGTLVGLEGGFESPAQGGAAVGKAAALLPGFALGAAAAALVLQLGGALYQTASEVGSDLAGVLGAGLDRGDPRNPAAVASLVANHVGVTAYRGVDWFVSATASNVACLLIGSTVLSDGGPMARSLSFTLFPVVVRTFGLLASGFGIMVVRADDRTGAGPALRRGRITTGVIATGGIAGTSLWLFGEDHFAAFFVAGLLGLVSAAAVSSTSPWRTDRRYAALRDVLEATRSGAAPTVAQGLGIGLEATVLPVVLVGGALVGAAALGTSTSLTGSSALAVVTALMAMQGEGAYMLGIGTFASISESARRVTAMNATTDALEPRGVARRLDDAGFSYGAIARTYSIVVGATTATTVLTAVVLGARSGTGPTSPASPFVLLCGALGATAAFAYVGNVTRRCARGARAVAMEVERQLRGFPRQGGVADVPFDFTPRYRTCVELTARASLDRLLVPVMFVVLLPVALALGLDLLGAGAAPDLPRQGLVFYALLAGAAGLTTSLAVDGARSTLVAARRACSIECSGPVTVAAIQGSAVGRVIGDAAGPALHLFVKTSAVAALAIAALLT